MAECCENGSKATALKFTKQRLVPDFFAAHPLAELNGWIDHALEAGVRITHPLRYDAASNRYLAVGWEQASRCMQPRCSTARVSGRAPWLLPRLGRIEIATRAVEQDRLSGGSTGCFHASDGVARPADPGLRSGTTIVAALVQATMPPGADVPRAPWTHDQRARRH